MSRLDGRIHSVRVTRKWQRDIINDLGGEAALSTAQRTIVEMAVRTRLLLEHLDADLLARKTIINKRKARAVPLVEQRGKLADSLARQLTMLGLERKHTTLPALAQYVGDRYPRAGHVNGRAVPQNS